MVSTTDANGNTTSYTYDLQGNLISITDGLGNTESYTYDTENQLTSHTDANGNTETFAYDVMGNMVLHTDALGASTAYKYDAHANLIEQVDAYGNTTTYEISPADTLTKLVQPNGAEYKYTYDNVGRLTSATSPKGYVRNFVYSTFDNPIEENDNTGASTKYVYDAQARLASITDALGNVSSIAYDALGNPSVAVDGVGNTTNYTYDALGRLVSYKQGSDIESVYTYDGRGNLTSEKRGNATRSYAYDGVSNLISTTDGKGAKTNYVYDALGNVTSQTDSLGNKTSFVYDALGNMVSTTDPSGSTTKYVYDAQGNVTETLSPKGVKTSYAYDLLGHLKKVEDGDGSTTSYEYDALGNITEVIDGLGKKTSYTYDVEGNLSQITGPSGASEKMEYDLKSRLSLLTTPDGATARYSYDALNNMIEKSYSTDNNEQVLYSFDAEGRVVARDDKTGDATYEYDSAGRLVSETDGSGQKLTYTYDASGNLASVTYPDGTCAAYAYDANGNIISVSAPEGEYIYSYDSENRPLSLSRPNNTSTLYKYDEMGHTVSIENKDANGEKLSSYYYTYNEEGNIKTESSDVAQSKGNTYSYIREFTYTDACKLESVSESGDGGQYVETYTYDASGNRVHLERTGEGADSIDYEYDLENRLTKTTSSKDGETLYTYDGAGNLISKTGAGIDTAYSYGVEGRLEAVREGGRLLMAATYDGDGNRVAQANLYHQTRQLEADSSGLGSLSGVGVESSLSDGGLIGKNISAFIYGFAALATAFGSSANVPAMFWAVDTVISILYSSSPCTQGLPTNVPLLVVENDAILPGEKDSIAASAGIIPRGLASTEEVFDVVGYVNSTLSGTSQVMSYISTRSGTTNETYGIERLATTTMAHTSYFMHDGRGSVSQTVDRSGSPTSWKTYSAFGEVSASSDLGEIPTYGYNSEEQNPLTGLTYMRFRYYAPDTSTFGVQDTYLGDIFNPLTLNRYLYCLANPVNYVDPTGHISLGRSSIGSALTKPSVKARKRGGTRINGNSFANSPGQKTIYNPYWTSYNPDIKARNLNAAANEHQWKFERAIAARNFSLANYHRQQAEKIKKKYRAYYCGSAEKIGIYVYNRDTAIAYAQKYSKDWRSEDPAIDYLAALFVPGYRNPMFPTSYQANCTNFTSQVLFAGGIKMTEDWHMTPNLSRTDIVLQLAAWNWYRNIYQLWNKTPEWTVARKQFNYFSDPKNGYINGDVINITLPGKPALNGTTEVRYSELNSHISSLGVQAGDLLYFYNSEGVHHATVVSKVDETGIYYSGNTTPRFDRSLYNVNIDDEYGFLIVRLKDVGLCK